MINLIDTERQKFIEQFCDNINKTQTTLMVDEFLYGIAFWSIENKELVRHYPGIVINKNGKYYSGDKEVNKL